MIGRTLRRRLFRRVAVLALVGGAFGCGHDFEPPDRAGRVSAADARYSPMLFDSIGWSDVGVRTTSGNAVYVERCRRCHGQLGLGDTEYARERGMQVPSLVEPGERLDELDTIRHAVFQGHEVGMPIFGDGVLSAREIDAVAAYVIFVLRPEMVGQE